MKAKVQYGDYSGTTSADRNDMFVDFSGQMTEFVIKKFNIPLSAENYHFVGISVSGVEVNSVCVYFFFKNSQTYECVKYFVSSVDLQSILNLFKRFEFQVGNHLEEIDENLVSEVVAENNYD